MVAKSKGINEEAVDNFITAEAYNGRQAALKFAQKKHIGPYRKDEKQRTDYFKKDMATLLRAGFDYDDVSDILSMKGLEQ